MKIKTVKLFGVEFVTNVPDGYVYKYRGNSFRVDKKDFITGCGINENNNDNYIVVSSESMKQYDITFYRWELVDYENEQKETKMKPFNLEQALAGKKVVTRSGHVIPELLIFTDRDQPYPLVGTCGTELNRWTLEGKYSAYVTEANNLDLFMASEKKQSWAVVRWESLANNKLVVVPNFESEEAANKHCNELSFVKTILLHEWEE